MSECREATQIIKISIIIAVHNESKYIDSFMKSLLLNNVSGKDDFEVIFIDDHSSDNSYELLKKWQRELPFTTKVLFNSVNRGPAFSRNVGLASAVGEIVVFVDCDCILESNWLDVIRKIAGKIVFTNTVGVGGAILPLYDFNSSFQCVMAKFQLHRPRATAKGTIIDLPAGNVMYLKRAISEVGGFNETLRFGEDSELSHRIVIKGWNLDYTKALKIYHQIPTCIGKLLKSQFCYGKSFAAHLKQIDGFSWKLIIGNNFFGSILWVIIVVAAFLAIPFMPVWWSAVFLVGFVTTVFFSSRYLIRSKIIKRKQSLKTIIIALCINRCLYCAYQTGFVFGGLYAKK